MARRKLFGNFVHFNVRNSPSERAELPITEKEDEIVENLDGSDLRSLSQLQQFRTITEDRVSQYDAYDEMATDSVIAAALEMYADDATQTDEKGRVIWVESEIPEIAKAGNRLLDIFEIPERAWKHIYQACKYGDYYLKLYRVGDLDDQLDIDELAARAQSTRVVNDKVTDEKRNLTYTPPYEEYVEDVPDPATVFDLRKRGKTAGFVQVKRADNSVSSGDRLQMNITNVFSVTETEVYRPDRLIHIQVSESLARTTETVTLTFDNNGEDTSVTYDVNRGQSILYDVYPIQKELQLLEDSLLLNRLTRSSLIRLLEIEVGDMPKKEVNNYLRRIKNLIEQHISLDKTTGDYKSFNAPGPIDNVIYIPVNKGKGHVDINNLGGDVNIRDIADIDYFNNKRAGALKIPKAYLGEDMDGSGLSNGGSLTRLSIRYARTVKRIQQAYIRAITLLLNLFFEDKKLDYVNKFKVRMVSPSTQEDLERNELINGNIELVGNIMELLGSFTEGTQKSILTDLINEVLKMPEIAEKLKEDAAPSDGEGGEDIVGDIGSPDFGDSDFGGDDFDGGTMDLSDTFEPPESSSGEGSEEVGGFTDDEYSSFEDEL